MAGHQPPAPRVELDEQWDAALEYSIRSVIYSTIGGCVAAYSLFRTPGTRKMVMGIGFGFGMGNAFHASQRELRRLWGHSEERAA